MSEPIDKVAREHAVDPSRSYIVQAPAGSGKTELLTDRILALLAIVERPEDILAITFTRKAAAEMRARVMEKLQKAEEPEPLEAYRQASWKKAKAVLERNTAKNWQLIENPSRLRIQTIDSFCQSLVRLTPSLSESGAGLSPTEDSQQLFYKATQKMLQHIDKHPSIAVILDHLDVNVGKFQSLLVDMLSRRQNWLGIVQNQAKAMETMAETLGNIIQTQLEQLDKVLPHQWLDDIRGVITEAAFTLEAEDNAENTQKNFLKPWLSWNGQTLIHSIEDIALWKSLADFLLTGKGEIRQRVDKKIGILPKSSYKEGFLVWLKQLQDLPQYAEIVSGLNDIRYIPKQLYNPDNKVLFESFFDCLKQSEIYLQEVFREEGSVDFTEIAQRALMALENADGSPTEMLLKLDADLKHILIDEFQDTSLSQKKLLELITSGWERDDGRTLFLVGDPMQSIYRFRQSEVALFSRIAEAAKDNTLLPKAEKKNIVGDVVLDLLQLQVNFRSDAGVVEWVNRNFTQVFPSEDNPDLGAIRYTPSSPFNQAKDTPAVQYHHFSFIDNEQALDEKSQKQKGSKEVLEDNAEQYIVQLVQEALARHSDSKHPVAILVRSRSHIGRISEKLTQANIPIQAVKMVSLGQTEEVIDLIQLVRALTHEWDRLAWMSLLRAPFCGLSLVSLTRLFEDKKEQSIPSLLKTYLQDEQALVALIGQDEAKRLMHLAVPLVYPPYTKREMTFTSYIEQVWEDLGANALYHLPTQQENIQAVLHIIDDLAPYGQLDLALFESRIENLYATPSKQAGAVEIMTMHSAKGLEFDEVILYGLHRIPCHDTGGLLEIESEEGHLLIGPIKHTATEYKDDVSLFIKARNDKRQRNEVDRLLYVACTRAKQKLHLVYVDVEDKAAHDKRTMLSSIVMDLKGKEGTFYHPQMITPVVPIESTEAYPFITQDKLRRYTLDTIASIKTPVSIPKVFTPLHTGKWSFESRQEAAIGTVVHQWLEQIGLDKMQEWTSERVANSSTMITRHLRRLGVEAIEAATQRVITLLQGVLADTKGQWLLSHKDANREWALSNEEGQQKIIDLVLNTPEGWLVVDYKTDARFDGESSDDFQERLKRAYREQLTNYANYLHLLDGRTVKAVIYAVDGCEWIELF
ncbi:UvrD-helicase domain-containing protein [Pelistega ratti]|uniref:UvrD-helicase domain-containing protein n=1 Tax=Pelistega ratti TaxID=2652177 RepID=UPI00135B06B1|nr:UvrD-helicase domain-containing protein [Pelistega ratti]